MFAGPSAGHSHRDVKRAAGGDTTGDPWRVRDIIFPPRVCPQCSARVVVRDKCEALRHGTPRDSLATDLESVRLGRLGLPELRGTL